MKVLGNDERKITALYGPNDNWKVCLDETNKEIKCYLEDSNVPWFAIYGKFGITMRINSCFVESVVYVTEKGGEPAPKETAIK